MPVTPSAEQRRGRAPAVQWRAGFPAVHRGPGQDRCWDPLRTSRRGPRSAAVPTSMARYVALFLFSKLAVPPSRILQSNLQALKLILL